MNPNTLRTLLTRLSSLANPTRTPTHSRSYYTNSTRKTQKSLYTIISPLGDPKTSVAPELDDWVQKGKKVSVAELQRIIRDLRKRRRYTQALEVSEWMNNKGICIFSPAEHAVCLDLIGKVRGFDSAETYFNSLKDHEKTIQTYGALLNCYVRQHQTEKALTHMQKMKELGFDSPLSYNGIMNLYTNIGQPEKVPDVLNEMKANNISPDNVSYRIYMNSYGSRNDIEGVENVLKEMESQSHIVMDSNTYAKAAHFYLEAGQLDKATVALRKSEDRLHEKDGLGYNILISLHSKMGNKSDVLRLWDLEKDACKRYINRDYLNMLESLVRLDALEEAEKVLKEWESSNNCYDFQLPNVVISSYAQKGLYEKATTMLEELMKKGKVCHPSAWGMVALGYANEGYMEKAVKYMKTAFSFHVKGWRPNGELITKILNWLSEEGSLEDLEAFVDVLKTVIPVNKQMYRALINAHVREGKEMSELLESMKADNIEG